MSAQRQRTAISGGQNVVDERNGQAAEMPVEGYAGVSLRLRASERKRLDALVETIRVTRPKAKRNLVLRAAIIMMTENKMFNDKLCVTIDKMIAAGQ